MKEPKKFINEKQKLPRSSTIPERSSFSSPPHMKKAKSLSARTLYYIYTNSLEGRRIKNNCGETMLEAVKRVENWFVSSNRRSVAVGCVLLVFVRFLVLEIMFGPSDLLLKYCRMHYSAHLRGNRVRRSTYPELQPWELEEREVFSVCHLIST